MALAKTIHEELTASPSNDLERAYAVYIAACARAGMMVCADVGLIMPQLGEGQREAKVDI